MNMITMFDDYNGILLDSKGNNYYYSTGWKL